MPSVKQRDPSLYLTYSQYNSSEHFYSPRVTDIAQWEGTLSPACSNFYGSVCEEGVQSANTSWEAATWCWRNPPEKNNIHSGAGIYGGFLKIFCTFLDELDHFYHGEWKMRYIWDLPSPSNGYFYSFNLLSRSMASSSQLSCKIPTVKQVCRPWPLLYRE